MAVVAATTGDGGARFPPKKAIAHGSFSIRGSHRPQLLVRDLAEILLQGGRSSLPPFLPPPDLNRHRIRLMDICNHYDAPAARHRHQPQARNEIAHRGVQRPRLHNPGGLEKDVLPTRSYGGAERVSRGLHKAGSSCQYRDARLADYEVALA